MKKILALIILVLTVGVGSVFWFNYQDKSTNQVAGDFQRIKSGETSDGDINKAKATQILEIYIDQGSSEGPYLTIDVYRDSSWKYHWSTYGGSRETSGKIDQDLTDQLEKLLSSELERMKSMPTPLCAFPHWGVADYRYTYFYLADEHTFDYCTIFAYPNNELFKLTSKIESFILNKNSESRFPSLNSPQPFELTR